MSNRTYRLTALHQSIDEAIRMELKRLTPSGIRLLRLKKLKLAVGNRLKFPLRARPETA